MSDIKVGDLVMVIGDCCGAKALGKIFIVESIHHAHKYCCRHCSFSLINGELLAFSTVNGRSGYWPLNWLRRIPPLSELEPAETKEELPA